MSNARNYLQDAEDKLSYARNVYDGDNYSRADSYADDADNYVDDARNEL